MRIRNLTADSMPEAMALVRAQLGVDAVILSTHSDGLDGKVRVTAALEDDDPDDQDLQSIGARSNSIDSLTGTLSFHRLPETLSNRMLTIAARLDHSDAAVALGGALDAELRFAKVTDLSHDRPIMLVGPPGAGKTSTAAKLCTLARLADCGTRMITLDSVKAGGLAQITTYGDALGAQVAAASDPDDLMEKLSDQPANTLTLIDTVGANPFDRQELAMLRQVADRARAAPILVLPAGGDAIESAEVAMAFSEVGTRAVISTKLDISRRLGGLLAALHASGLPLMAIARSPQIVEGLTPINPISLARLMFASSNAAQLGRTPAGETP